MNLHIRLPRTGHHAAIAIVALAVTGGTFLAMTGVAAAATPPPATSQSPVAAAASSHSDIVHKGMFSVEETITNNTDSDWTFDPQNTNEGTDNHWQQRPQQTLKAHTQRGRL